MFERCLAYSGRVTVEAKCWLEKYDLLQRYAGLWNRWNNSPQDWGVIALGHQILYHEVEKIIQFETDML